MSRSPVWHPFTQHGLEPDMLAIARAEGASKPPMAGASSTACRPGG